MKRAAICLERRAAALAVLALAGLLRGCTLEPAADPPQPQHGQPAASYEPQAASDFFYDGAAMRAAGAGHGRARRAARGPARTATGKDAAGAFVAAIPVAGRRRAAARAARDRYAIYCQPCHDERGDGKGILFERGKVPTPSFHTDKRCADARRPALRHHHQRLGPDAGLPLADPGGRPLGDHRPRARAAGTRARRAPAAGGAAPVQRRAMRVEDRRRGVVARSCSR